MTDHQPLEHDRTEPAPLDTTIPAPHDGMTVVGYEAVSGEETAAPLLVTPRAPRRRRTAIVLSIATALVVLLGVGAYAGVRLWTGSGIAEPETAVPASTAAFARIDVNPGYRDKIAFDNLAKKFPTNNTSTSNLIIDVEKTIASRAHLNYDTDVKPWFGGRAGVGEWTDPSGKPVLLLVFASKNDAAAKATLTKISARYRDGSFGFVVRDGYALVMGTSSNAQADATAAAAQAQAHSLAEAASFSSTVGHLSGNNLVLAYLDLGKLGSLMATELGGLTGGLDNGLDGTGGLGGDGLGGLTGGAGGGFGPLGLLGTMSALQPDSLHNLTGTVAAGVSVVDDGVEIRVHEQGMTPAGSPSAKTNVRSTLDAMPDSTVAGIALDGLDPSDAVIKQLNLIVSALTGGLGSDNPDGSGDPQAQAMGQLVSGVLTTLLTSKVISVAFTGVDAGKPDLQIVADTGDSGKAASLLTAVQQLTQAVPVPGIAVAQDGTRVRATIGTPPIGGRLANSALYRETMAGMSTATMALYLDVQKLAQVGVASIGRAQMAPVRAIGMATSSTSTSTDTLIRIVIKK